MLFSRIASQKLPPTFFPLLLFLAVWGIRGEERRSDGPESGRESSFRNGSLRYHYCTVLQILSLSVSPRWHRTIRPAGVAVLPVHTQVLPTWYCDSTVCSISTVLSIRPILPCCFSPSPDSPAGCYRIGLLFFPLHTHLVLALVSVGSFFLRARYS